MKNENENKNFSDCAEYLVDRYKLANKSCVKFSHSHGTVHCFGQMPNSIETGWFLAGSINGLLQEMEAIREMND